MVVHRVPVLALLALLAACGSAPEPAPAPAPDPEKIARDVADTAAAAEKAERLGEALARYAELTASHGATAAAKDAAAATARLATAAEAAAFGWIEKAVDSQLNFFRRNRRYALTFEELQQAHLIMEEPDKDVVGYDFRMRPTPAADRYSVIATPVHATPGAVHFYADMKSGIRAEKGKEATDKSPRYSPPRVAAQ